MFEPISLKEYEVKTSVIWGAKNIAEFLDISVHGVYDLAQDPKCPIFKPAKRYVAIKPELFRWLRTKPNPDDLSES